MAKRRCVALAALIGLLAAATPAVGHYQDWVPASWALQREVSTWRTTSDSMYARAWISWVAAGAAGMRHMATHGNRFTHDVHDNNANLNATGRWSTGWSNPFYDKDYNSTTQKWDEAEITAESATFPTAEIAYGPRVEFSHWFWYCPPRLACKWAWDSGGGSLAQTAQISRQLCPSPPCDKWDADPDLADKFMGNTTYPSLSQPASTSSLGAEGPVETTPTGTGGPDHWVAPYQIVAQERQGEASISPDLTRGLADYRTRAHRLAQRVAVAGHVDARPVGDLALEELLALGLEVQSVEAVTRPDDGVRWTYGAPYEAGVVADLSGTAAAEGRELLGVVAATVVVGGADQVRKIIGDERVYLLDLAHEHVLRNRPDITDVEQNDMYWVVAGWD